MKMGNYIGLIQILRAGKKEKYVSPFYSISSIPFNGTAVQTKGQTKNTFDTNSIKTIIDQ